MKKTSEAHKVILRTDNHQIVSVYDRRYLVQRYNGCNNSWMTVKICKNDAEARQALRERGVEL